MSDDDNTPPTEADKDVRMKDAFAPGAEGKPVGALFKPEEMDIYTNKVTMETYIFHGKDVNYESLDHLVYNPDDYTVTVVKKDGSTMDLGVKIQWLVRPYFSKADEVSIVQTKDGESINGTVVPLKHKGTDA